MSFRSLCLFLLYPLTLFGESQGVFEGPVNLKVWKHWQESWNVENQNKPSLFRLDRGVRNAKPYVYLVYSGSLGQPTAVLTCHTMEREGEWSLKEKVGPNLEADGKTERAAIVFDFEKAESCVDVSEKQFVTRITFTIFDGGKEKLAPTTLIPMFVRGKNAQKWNNPIEAYRAHAGAGEIKVAGVISEGDQKDKWDGREVKPEISFMERNTLRANARIGLHRHESNQEAYLIEEGRAEMVMGRAKRAGGEYEVKRRMFAKGEEVPTQEFLAEGGWIEKRIVEPGQIAIIVPEPHAQQDVYFHGLTATTDLLFWTLGSKN